MGWIQAPRQKPSRWGSVLVDDMRGGSHVSQGDLFWVGKGGVEVVGACDRAVHEGGPGFQAPCQKPSRWGSVLVDDMRGGSYSCRGDLIGVG